MTPRHPAMTFLHSLVGVPGLPICLRIFKKQFQIGSGERCIVFDDQNHIASCPLDQSPKLVIALCRIGGENPSFAQHLCQQRLERTHLIALLSNGTLVQDNTRLYLLDMQHMLLWLLSPIHLIPGPFENFPINRQVNAPLAGLGRQTAGFLSTATFRPPFVPTRPQAGRSPGFLSRRAKEALGNNLTAFKGCGILSA